jgi:7-cyano-7-deazaguanine synthase in queuosine biosynthesis
MQIGNIDVSEFESHTQVSGNIGRFPLWFKYSRGHRVNEADATPFLIAALTPAMLLGEDVIVDDRYYVSEKVFSNLPLIQTIINCWNPIFKKIKVQARTTATLPEKSGCGAFFSSGVDSLYTLVKHQQEIDQLILINGFDFNADTAAWEIMIKRCQRIAKIYKKELLIVETNLKEFNSFFNLSRFANFGATLATIGQLLDFKTVFLNSADTYEKIFTSGSHPLLDPLWSTEACEIIHTGLEADRTKKIELIKSDPNALNNLWFCLKDPNANCGKCNKCIRTYIALKLNGVDDFKFSNPVHISDIAKISIENEEILNFFEKFRVVASEQGKHDINRQLRKLILEYKIKSFIKDIDTYVFNSKIQHWKRRHSKSQNELTNISVLPRYTDELMLRKTFQDLASHSKVESKVLSSSIFTLQANNSK